VGAQGPAGGGAEEAVNSKLIKILFLLIPLTIMADGQHDPTNIPKFLQAL
jgi:hypothetical protein